MVKAPSTLGTFLRSFRWGHVRQLDRVSRQLLARAWAAGAGPGDSPLTIDLDSTICETYGLAKEGARHHGYTGARGYHPLLAIAAGTGEVLMSRLREGRANTARGAAHFLRETVGRGALRRGYSTAHGAGRQRLLWPHCRFRLPGNGCPLLHHRPPARQPAGPDRGDTGGGLDSHSLLDGRRRRCCRDDLHPVPEGGTGVGPPKTTKTSLAGGRSSRSSPTAVAGPPGSPGITSRRARPRRQPSSAQRCPHSGNRSHDDGSGRRVILSPSRASQSRWIDPEPSVEESKLPHPSSVSSLNGGVR